MNSYRQGSYIIFIRPQKFWGRIMVWRSRRRLCTFCFGCLTFVLVSRSKNTQSRMNIHLQIFCFMFCVAINNIKNTAFLFSRYKLYIDLKMYIDLGLRPRSICISQVDINLYRLHRKAVFVYQSYQLNQSYISVYISHISNIYQFISVIFISLYQSYLLYQLYQSYISF